jgi:hypothetical protein
MTRRPTPEKPITNLAAEAPAEVSESPTGNAPIPGPDGSPARDAPAAEDIDDRQSNLPDERNAVAGQAAQRAVEPFDDGYEPL